MFCETGSLLGPTEPTAEEKLDLKISQTYYTFRVHFIHLGIFQGLFVINTGQHWKKTLIFAPTELFLGSTDPSHCRNSFEKLSDKSRKAWFIPLAHLLVFVSQLDSAFIKKPLKILF